MILKQILACDFCGKSQDEVKRLIAGPPPKTPCICDVCIRISVEIDAKEVARLAAKETPNG